MSTKAADVATVQTWAGNLKIHWLPIDHDEHTEVLGYRRGTNSGAALWKHLDWSKWWIDGPDPHMFNAGGYYLHVQAEDEAVYRVRCWYAGRNYRGAKVTDVGIGSKDGKLHWIVRTGSLAALSPATVPNATDANREGMSET